MGGIAPFVPAAGGAPVAVALLVVPQLAPLLLAARLARRARPVPLVAAASGAVVGAVGTLVWAVADRPTAVEPPPAPARAAWVLQLAVVAVLLVREVRPVLSVRSLAEVALVVCGGATALLLLPPVARVVAVAGENPGVLAICAGQLVLAGVAGAGAVYAVRPSPHALALCAGPALSLLGVLLLVHADLEGHLAVVGPGSLVATVGATTTAAALVRTCVPAAHPARRDPLLARVTTLLAAASAGAVALAAANGRASSAAGTAAAAVLLLAVGLWSADTTALRRAVRTARRRGREARTDHLTRLPNRRALLEHLAAVTASGRPAAVALLDLDQFKTVNDAHGHLAGDVVLRDVAGLLRGWTAGWAQPYRLGGDEFVVVTSPDDADRAVPLLRDRLEAAVAERHAGLGASMGVARTPQDAADALALLAVADARMYADKHTRAPAGRPQSSDERSRRRVTQ